MTAAAERYGVDWSKRTLTYGDYPAGIDRMSSIIRTAAPNAHEVAVFEGAHSMLGLTRLACGRDGLQLLAAWYAKAFKGRTVEEMTALSRAWLKAQHAQRKAALDRIEELCTAIILELNGRPDVDIREVCLELEEITIGVDCHREAANQNAPDHCAFVEWMPSTPAVKALRSALRRFPVAYPCRTPETALYTPEQISAAMPLRGVR